MHASGVLDVAAAAIGRFAVWSGRDNRTAQRERHGNFSLPLSPNG
jgi:hypothetical protein